MVYKVLIERGAEKDLETLDPKLRKRIVERILFSFAEYSAACCGDIQPSQPKKLLRRSRQGEENNPSVASAKEGWLRKNSDTAPLTGRFFITRK